MKNLALFIFLLICAGQATAQQSQLQPVDSLSTKSFSLPELKSKPYTFLNPQLDLENLVTPGLKSSILVGAHFMTIDHMPIAVIKDYSKMPVIKLQGYSKMPVKRIDEADERIKFIP